MLEKNVKERIFLIMFIHTEKAKIQCRYESPREEAKEVQDCWP
jgi:hypothetical protein